VRQRLKLLVRRLASLPPPTEFIAPGEVAGTNEVQTIDGVQIEISLIAVTPGKCVFQVDGATFQANLGTKTTIPGTNKKVWVKSISVEQNKCEYEIQ